MRALPGSIAGMNEANAPANASGSSMVASPGRAESRRTNCASAADSMSCSRNEISGLLVVYASLVPQSMQPLEGRVASIGAQQLCVRAAFDDAPAFQVEDLIGACREIQSVRDEEGRPALSETFQSLDDGLLVLPVQSGGRLIQDQNGSPAYRGTRDRDPLALSVGQSDAPLTQHGVVPVGHRRDEFVGARETGGCLDLRGGHVGCAEGDVVPHTCREQEGVLEYDAHLCTQ